MTASETKEQKINETLQALDDALELGPENGQAPEAFLRQVVSNAEQLVGELKTLTPEDVDEIWEDDGDEENG
jgi:hypothetical protein